MTCVAAVVELLVCILSADALESSYSSYWKFPGFQVHDVSGDGQCGFSAIGHQLAVNNYKPDGADVSGRAIRREILDCIRSNENLRRDIAPRLVNGMNIDEYLEYMGRDTTWIDDNALSAASELYDATVCILRENEISPTRIGSSTSNPSIVLGFVSTVPGEQPNHYISLVPGMTTVMQAMTHCVWFYSFLFCTLSTFISRSYCYTV